MDINIQRELNCINDLFNVSKSEKKKLEERANEFISSELVNIGNNKENEMFMRINNILEQICNEIQKEFNIDKIQLKHILEQHKFKLCSESLNNNCENSIKNNSDSDSSDSDSDSDNENNVVKENSKSKKDEDKNNKDDNRKKLTQPIKCPAHKGNNGELCGRLTIKSCNYEYCGYHKKYFKA